MQWNHSFEKGAMILNQKRSLIQGDDASIFIHYWAAQSKHYNNKQHQHSFFELCYIVNGKGTYVDDGKTFPITNGTLFLSRPYIKHQILSETGLDIIFIGFEIEEKETLNEIYEYFFNLQHTEHFIFPQSQSSPVVQLWTALLALVNEPCIDFNNAFQGLCSAFFASILKQFGNKQEDNKKRPNRTSAFLVYQAKLYIHDNLHKKLQLNDVAAHIYISGRHLSRIFRSELEQTFSNYVRKEKVTKAGILLSNTNLTHEEIAENTGFENVHYFSTVFSAEMGMPPGIFRTKFRKEQYN